MSFLLYRQNRQHLCYLSMICLAALLLLMCSGYFELLRFREQVFLREKQMVSAILKEGIPTEQITAVCSDTDVTADAEALLLQMGHSEHTFLFHLPLLKSTAIVLSLQKTVAGLILAAAVLFGAIRYMKKQDQLYQEAADLVERYAKGDFAGHLPVGDQNGTLHRLFASIDQLARALQVQYEAEHTSREFLKDTISDISHQLKTPLAALNMYTDIIAGEPDCPETVRVFSEKSMQSLLRMEDLIQSLLKIVRLDTGNILFEKKEVPVQELVLRAIECLQTRAEQEGKKIQMEGDPEEIVCCDPAWTAEALGNLVKNALDHTEEGGVLRILWEDSPVMIRLSVADDGCGIPPEEIHHIFKRFYRSSRSSDRQGVGLGLPLAKTIIEGQGGTLSVTSEVGEGTVFSVTFFKI